MQQPDHQTTSNSEKPSDALLVVTFGDPQHVRDLAGINDIIIDPLIFHLRKIGKHIQREDYNTNVLPENPDEAGSILRAQHVDILIVPLLEYGTTSDAQDPSTSQTVDFYRRLGRHNPEVKILLITNIPEHGGQPAISLTELQQTLSSNVQAITLQGVAEHLDDTVKFLQPQDHSRQTLYWTPKAPR